MKEVLKARQADMLKYLIRAGTPLDLDFFKAKFEKQDRTIRYDLGELKDICARHGIEICYQTKQGYYIPATQKSKASGFLVQCEITTKTGLGDSSEEERFESLFLYLFVQKGYVTSEKMAAVYYLSRSTLSRTLGKMEVWSERIFSLEVRKASGYRLKGEEMALRRLAAKILAARFRGSYTVEDWFMLMPPEFKGKLLLQDVAEISQNIRRLNSKYNVWISNASYLNLLCYCMVRRLRMRIGYVIEEPVTAEEETDDYDDAFLKELFGSEEREIRGELGAFSQILRENGVYIQKGFVEEVKLVERMPDSSGLANEIILQKGHAINFNVPIETMIRLGGGVPVEAGTATEVAPEDIEEAITDKTVALMYVKSHHCVQKGMVDLPTMIEIAHRNSLPLLVDAAAEEDFRKYIAMGADLVCYSGAKALEATTSGFVTGKKEYIAYARKQYKGIGRAMKIGKEGIMGLLEAHINSLVSPCGKPGFVKISTGPLSKDCEPAVVPVDTAIAMIKEMGGNSVKFFPMGGLY